MLWKMLLHLGHNKKRKETAYQPIITHDVDVPFLWNNNSPKRCLKEAVKVILRPSMKQFKRAKSSIVSLLNYKKDPHWTFELLMDISEAYGLKSYFFFMSGGTSDKDNFFKIDSPKITSLIQNIKEKGHHIGFHPSYNGHNDFKQFQHELQKLTAVSNTNIHFGRQHYLRFEVPKTWELWDASGCTWESTMGYAGHIGFRSGICTPYTTFNFLERKPLKVKERPLIAMDCTLFDYMNLSNEQGLVQLEELKKIIKRYKGEFVFLWHNSYFQRPDFSYNRLEFYKNAIKLLAD